MIRRNQVVRMWNRNKQNQSRCDRIWAHRIVLRLMFFCLYERMYFTIAASFLMKHRSLHLFFVIRIGHVQSQQKLAKTFQRILRLDLIFALIYAWLVVTQSHTSYRYSLYRVHTSMFIITNCFSIMTNAQTLANKWIHAHFITQLHWVFLQYSITNSLASEMKDESNMGRSWP